MRARWILPVLSILAAAGAVSARASLGEYVGKPDPDFRWSRVSETVSGSVRIIHLKMRSQTWRGIPWEHNIQVFVPAQVKHPRTAGLLITGGNPGREASVLGAALAPRFGAPFAVLYNIPNQPLFDGKSEDDLIAHTFAEYLKSSDETWPLLFPMVKSAVRAMDAIQELSKEWPEPIRDFVVTGASKRGWTTYLTGAADRRVRAIAPMVFDNLNFVRQMPRQLELWGKYSEQIDDYTRRGLQQQLETPGGRKLVSMVDPWFYRRRLAMPKLLIHGANDRYWSTDATRIYWDDLPGDKYLLSVPNSGHGLEDRGRVLNALTAFFHAVASDRKLPKLEQEVRNGGRKAELRVKSSAAPKEVRIWVARAADLDFRPVKWEPVAATAGDRSFLGTVDLPEAGGVAFFAEAEYEENGDRFTLTTPSTVLGSRK